MTQTTQEVYNFTKNFSEKFSVSTRKINVLHSQYELKREIELFSTTITSFNAVKTEIENRSSIEYPVSTLEKNKKAGNRYCTKKMRDAIAQMLFSSKSLSDDRWSAIRSMSLSCRTLQETEPFQEMRDKSKVYYQQEFDFTLAIALYMKLKHPTKFPSINRATFQRCKSWLRLEYPYIDKIEVSFPSFSVSRFSEELKLYCPWFSVETLEKPELKKELINYGNLSELLKKTFYGYCPTPQYIGKLGFDAPQSREYSLQDYYAIRAAIIKSQRSRRKPDNYLIFEEF